MSVEAVLDTTMIKDIAVVAPKGRVDAFTVAPLEEWLSEARARSIVDLQAVTFLDTRAITVLVQGMKRCRAEDGDLKLSSPTQAVQIILETMRLDRAFEITPNVASAVMAFGE